MRQNHHIIHAAHVRFTCTVKHIPEQPQTTRQPTASKWSTWREYISHRRQALTYAVTSHVKTQQKVTDAKSNYHKFYFLKESSINVTECTEAINNCSKSVNEFKWQLDKNIQRGWIYTRSTPQSPRWYSTDSGCTESRPYHQEPLFSFSSFRCFSCLVLFVCTFSLFLFTHCTAHHRLRDLYITGSVSSIYWSWVITGKKKNTATMLCMAKQVWRYETILLASFIHWRRDVDW